MITKDSLPAFRETPRILAAAEGFIYLLPHPALRRWISNYTITFPRKGLMSDRYTVMPHGCATLVLSYDGSRFSGNLFGPATKPTCVGSEANRFQMLFITEFQPAGYYAFSKTPQKELADRLLPFEAVDPAFHHLIAQRLETTPDINALIAEIDKLFLAHLKTVPFRDEFSLANNIIVSSGGLISVKELSQRVFYSERHLGRIFGEYLGVNIKSFSRLVRVNKAIRILQKPYGNITQAHFQTGYYDLSHFVRDFKSICGITPQEYRDNASDFYMAVAKFRATMG